MPIKLIPPRPGKTPYYSGRGTHLGTYVDRSTKAVDARLAARVLRQWQRDIERGQFAGPQTQTGPTFGSATLAYLRGGGERRYLPPLIAHFRDTPLPEIDQAAIDDVAARLMPKASPATRNREIYTPVSAVLHHAGSTMRVRRPKGWRGNRSTSWLEPEQAFAVFAAADAVDREFGLLLRTLTYTGMRISEALSVRLADLNLQTAVLYLPRTKNGHARAVHLPPVLVKAFRAQPPRPVRRDGASMIGAGAPFLARPAQQRLFRFHRSGALRSLLDRTFATCNLQFPPRQGGFHLFCHTYGTWMHRYGGLDTYGLTHTGRWKDPDSANRYKHTMASAEARQADLLPVPMRQIKTQRRS